MTDRDRADADDVRDLGIEDDLEPEPGVQEGRVLAPEELDITESDHVSQIDENRFVVSADPIFPDSGGSDTGTDGSTSDRPSSTRTVTDSDQSAGDDRADSRSGDQSRIGDDSTPSADTDSEQPPDSSRSGDVREGPIDVSSARLRLAEELASADRRYGLEIVATFDDVVTTRRSTSDNVVATFEGFLRWYARQVTDEVPPDEALGVLLLEASIPITYPTANIGELLTTHDLGPNDSIADLLDAIESDYHQG
ncbi:MAG: DUF7500 family protein [Natronomonas sp.]